MMFRPADVEDLARLPRGQARATCRSRCIGVASNLLVRDGGVPGVVVRLGRGFAEIEIARRRPSTPAPARSTSTSRWPRATPGSPGSSSSPAFPARSAARLRMNAGAYGSEFKDVLRSRHRARRARAGCHELTPAEMGLAYRHCGVPEDWIFVSRDASPASAANPRRSAQRMAEIQAQREAQPADPRPHRRLDLRQPAGPQGLGADRRGRLPRPRAWRRAWSRRSTPISSSTPASATAADIEALGEEVRRRVLEKSGIELEWEIQRIGVALPAESGGAP